MKKVKNYLHYAPEFDKMFIAHKVYTYFWRNCFTSVATGKGKTKVVFIFVDDFGFTL